MPDYEFKTTFWNDFTIADRFGVNAVNDTYKKAFNEWKTDKVYLTELVLVLNWKIWEHYDKHNSQLAELYNTLWEQTDTYALDTLKNDDLTYYLTAID